MTRFLISSLAFAVFGGGVHADPDVRSPKDLFGQPRLHGPIVEKAFLGLYSGRIDLYFGQPMTVELFAIPATTNGPFVHPRLDHMPNVKLELKDQAGAAIPFMVESQGYSCGPEGEFIRFRLAPTKPHAVGWHWKPGTYILTAAVTNADEPTNPVTLPGTFRSNALTFVVRPADAKRDAADPKRELVPTRRFAGEDDHFWLHVAGLDEKSHEGLQKRLKFNSDQWAVHSARLAAVNIPQDRSLTPAEEAKLLADLNHKAPAVRMLAARSVPAGSGKKVLAALLATLTDRYEEVAPGSHPIVVYPIRGEAGATLVRLGGAIVPDLVRFARHDDNGPVRRECVRLLGNIGHHLDAEKWFLELLDGDVDELHYAVQNAAAKWEKAGAELSRDVLKRPKIRGEIRRDAIEALGNWGNLQTDGPTLRPLLAAPSGPQSAAVTALAQLKDVESLPAFEKIARDADVDQNTRYPAVNAVLRFAEPKTADKLLLDLIARPKDRLRGFALQRAGERRLMAALPVALAALDDRDWYTRVMADYALRGLGGDRAGVGYDPANPDSKSWRDFWSKRVKK